MISEITKFLTKYDLDVRKSHDARFMDQKCTPDVVCFIADCIINLNPQENEFTVQDVWDMPYFINPNRSLGFLGAVWQREIL